MKTSKKLIILICIALTTMLGLSGCRQPAPVSELGQVLQGEHALRKMGQLVGTTTKSSQCFFLVAYNQNEKKETTVMIKFSWQMNDGNFAISSLPLEKFRFKLDNKTTSPTIKFRWELSSNNPNLQEVMNTKIVYALLTIREDQWPVDIDLPMNR